MRNLVGVCAALAALVVPLAVASQALADPVTGHNSTPGTLTCGQTVFQTTSGSFAALAIQVVGSTNVFVVKSVPDFGIDHGGRHPRGQASDLHARRAFHRVPGDRHRVVHVARRHRAERSASAFDWASVRCGA